MNLKKRSITLMLCSIFVLPVFVFGNVGAEEDTDDDSQTSSSSEGSGSKKKTLEERIAERKAKLEEKLTALQEARLKNRCKSAQGKINQVENRINGIKTSRGKIYGNLTDRLKKLVEKLKLADVDTTKLESQITELETKITAFNTAVTDYETAVSDLVAMDCEADPEAFKASLEEARTLRETVVTAAKDIRMYVKETIKPTLQTIRKELEAEKEKEPETEEEDTTEAGGAE
jgi:hypothetical protein